MIVSGLAHVGFNTSCFSCISARRCCLSTAIIAGVPESILWIQSGHPQDKVACCYVSLHSPALLYKNLNMRRSGCDNVSPHLFFKAALDTSTFRDFPLLPLCQNALGSGLSLPPQLRRAARFSGTGGNWQGHPNCTVFQHWPAWPSCCHLCRSVDSSLHCLGPLRGHGHHGHRSAGDFMLPLTPFLASCAAMKLIALLAAAEAVLYRNDAT